MLLITFTAGGAERSTAQQQDQITREPHGAIIRGDVAKKQIALVFTGGDFGESTGPILDVLKKRHAKAGFFVTGDYLRQPALRSQLARMIAEGHYVGPHSDSHPLYCSWDDRNKTLVTQDFFKNDLQKNIADLREIGALKTGQPILFIPPYEWYNRDQVRWSRDFGATLINFTPGSGSNRDYAPEGNQRFIPSQKIYDDILAFEKKDPHGLNGFMLLLHLGSGRKDPFHPLLGPLCNELSKRGYKFVRVDELMK